MNDASHKITSISSSSKTHAVPTPSIIPEQDNANDAASAAREDKLAHGGTPWAMFALSAFGLLVGAFAVIGPEHVSMAVAKTLLTVGCVVVAALAGIVAADLSRRQ